MTPAPEPNATVFYTTPSDDTVLLRAPGRPDVECLMVQYEPYLYDTICDSLPDGARAAEVGSFKGGSACIVAHGMRRRGKRLHLACHDLFEPFDLRGEAVDIERAFDANTAAWIDPAWLTKVKGDSKQTHAVHADGSLDYVFIDGDHGYEGALADIRNFAPKLKPDGWLVIQDCVREVEQAVKRALPELKLPGMLVTPPYAHHVVVCHADEARLQAMVEALLDRVRRAKTAFVYPL